MGYRRYRATIQVSVTQYDPNDPETYPDTATTDHERLAHDFDFFNQDILDINDIAQSMDLRDVELVSLDEKIEDIA